MHYPNTRIAVLIPCFNEETTIGEVVTQFAAELPGAEIYVFDNNSSDKSAEVARQAGAIVVNEYRQGKGNVVRSMFRRVEADIYVMVDGDCTYPPSEVHNLIAPVLADQAHMVIGDRISSTYDQENQRPFHSFGNRLVRWLVNRLFHSNLKDIMSGYRAFDRLFVKSLPVTSDAFEIETEMTIYALERKFSFVEIPVTYKDRPKNRKSKLNTFSDGYKILKTISSIFKNYKPFSFFFVFFSFSFLISFLIVIGSIYEFINYNYVYKIPSAILAASLQIISFLFLFIGIILDTISSNHKEMHQMHINNYLSQYYKNVDKYIISYEDKKKAA